MKKFLLSLAVMCSAGFAANAETVTLTMADAVEIEGTETKDGNIPAYDINEGRGLSVLV